MGSHPDTAQEHPALERHRAMLTGLANMANCGVSVYDNHLDRHVFISYNFENLFGYDLQKAGALDKEYINTLIHPDDIPQLQHNGEATMRYFEREGRPEGLLHTKLISEYRMRGADGHYRRVTEQFQILEQDEDGSAWLSLSVLNISPNQEPLAGVQSRLMNCDTGEVYRLPEFGAGQGAPVLSAREKDILRLVRDGLLSKEISERLKISVHTVNTHRQRILEKLGADNSIEAVQNASRFGLLD